VVVSAGFNGALALVWAGGLCLTGMSASHTTGSLK